MLLLAGFAFARSRRMRYVSGHARSLKMLVGSSLWLRIYRIPFPYLGGTSRGTLGHGGIRTLCRPILIRRVSGFWTVSGICQDAFRSDRFSLSDCLSPPARSGRLLVDNPAELLADSGKESRAEWIRPSPFLDLVQSARHTLSSFQKLLVVRRCVRERIVEATAIPC